MKKKSILPEGTKKTILSEDTKKIILPEDTKKTILPEDTKKTILPEDITSTTLPVIKDITSALGLPRDVLASDEEIFWGWKSLPRELVNVPLNLRGPLLARMCVATSVGLFDGAINYIWNASVANLREKVKNFGYNVVGQLLQKKFEEKDLLDLKDSELLNLCLKINLISEDGYYFLGQCRDMRNNYSVAHPSDNLINDRELIVYINRCIKYALSSEVELKGVDISLFTSVIKESRFEEEQLNIWVKNIKETHDAQRELIFSMLHGIYSDPSSSEQTRLNALDICEKFKQDFTSNVISEFLEKHYKYQAKGNKISALASQQFFEKLGLIKYLGDEEIHNIISLACKRLMGVHFEMNNFYNEPPFAERLEELVTNNKVPESAKYNFVLTVVTCYVGNMYGQCNAALYNYSNMIKNFTSKEIAIMLDLYDVNKKTTLYNRITSYPRCKKNYKDAVKLLNEESVPTSLKAKYYSIIN